MAASEHIPQQAVRPDYSTGWNSEEGGTEVWMSLSKSLEVKGLQAGYSTPRTQKRPDRTRRQREIKVNLVLIKRGESTFVLIAQRMLIAAMCEIDF